MWVVIWLCEAIWLNVVLWLKGMVGFVNMNNIICGHIVVYKCGCMWLYTCLLWPTIIVQMKVGETN